MQLNINTNAVVIFTNKLEKMHRSVLPSAIRAALNDTVFYAKTKTILSEAKSTFTEREKNFFKVATRFDKAIGFDVKTMKATIGFTSAYLQSKFNYAAKDLEQQENGGEIGGRSFVALPQARIGQSFEKSVRKENRINKQNRTTSLSKIKNARMGRGKSRGTRFIRAAYSAGKGGYVLSEDNSEGKRFLFRVNSLNKTKEGKLKLTPMYAYQKGRQVSSKKKKGFMKQASFLASGKTEEFYIKQAEYYIKRNLK